MGNDVGPVSLPGVQLHRRLAFDIPANLLVGLDQPFGAEIPGEVHNGLVAGPLFVRHVLVATRPRHRLCLRHGGKAQGRHAGYHRCQ